MNNGKATAGLVLGIVGLIAWLLPLFGYPVNIIGIIMSAIGRKSENKSKATVGLVLSIIGLVLTLANSILGAMMAINSLNL